MGLVEEFKEFAMKGNVVDLAVGIIIGAEFGKIVNSMVSDIIMPPISLVLGKADYRDIFILLKEGSTAGPYLTLEQAQKAGAVTLNIGMFGTAILSFLIIAFSVFLVVKAMNRLRAKLP